MSLTPFGRWPFSHLAIRKLFYRSTVANEKILYIDGKLQLRQPFRNKTHLIVDSMSHEYNFFKKLQYICSAVSVRECSANSSALGLYCPRSKRLQDLCTTLGSVLSKILPFRVLQNGD